LLKQNKIYLILASALFKMVEVTGIEPVSGKSPTGRSTSLDRILKFRIPKLLLTGFAVSYLPFISLGQQEKPTLVSSIDDTHSAPAGEGGRMWLL